MAEKKQGGTLGMPLMQDAEQHDEEIEDPSDSASLEAYSSEFFLKKTTFQRSVIVSFALLATLLLFFSYFCLKILFDDYAVVNALHVLLAQSVALTVVVLLLAAILRANLLLVPSETACLLLVRCLVALVASVLLFRSLEHLSLGKAVAMAHTSPVFTALIAFVSLRESFRAADRFNLFFAFLGAAGLGLSLLYEPEEGVEADSQIFALLLCTIAAVLGAYSNALLREINISAHCLTAPLFLGLSGTFIGVLAMLFGAPGGFDVVLALEARALYLLAAATGAAVVGIVILSWAF